MRKQSIQTTGSVVPHSASQQLLILAGVCIAVLVLPLNFGGAAVSAPTIGTALGGAVQWQSTGS
jgi:hypothetical protein